MLLSLSEVMFEPCITSVLFVTGTDSDVAFPQLSGAQLRTDTLLPVHAQGCVESGAAVPVVVSARALHCRQHQVLLGT